METAESGRRPDPRRRRRGSRTPPSLPGNGGSARADGQAPARPASRRPRALSTRPPGAATPPGAGAPAPGGRWCRPGTGTRRRRPGRRPGRGVPARRSPQPPTAQAAPRRAPPRRTHARNPRRTGRRQGAAGRSWCRSGRVRSGSLTAIGSDDTTAGGRRYRSAVSRWRPEPAPRRRPPRAPRGRRRRRRCGPLQLRLGPLQPCPCLAGVDLVARHRLADQHQRLVLAHLRRSRRRSPTRAAARPCR